MNVKCIVGMAQNNTLLPLRRPAYLYMYAPSIIIIDKVCLVNVLIVMHFVWIARPLAMHENKLHLRR